MMPARIIAMQNTIFVEPGPGSAWHIPKSS
jgi:hypothetical protein